MTTPTREQVMAWVSQADAYASSQTSDFQEHGEIAAERLCALAMSAGREQGLRDAAELLREIGRLLKGHATPTTEQAALAIESLLKRRAAAIEQLRK